MKGILNINISKELPFIERTLEEFNEILLQVLNDCGKQNFVIQQLVGLELCVDFHSSQDLSTNIH
jgi:hypothetical protein